MKKYLLCVLFLAIVFGGVLLTFNSSYAINFELLNPLTSRGLPLNNPASAISMIIGGIIKALLLSIGAVAFLAVVYGGMLMLSAAGNSERINKGKTIITWAVIGVAVVLASNMMVSYVLNAITGGNLAGGGGTPPPVTSDCGAGADFVCTATTCAAGDTACFDAFIKSAACPSGQTDAKCTAKIADGVCCKSSATPPPSNTCTSAGNTCEIDCTATGKTEDPTNSPACQAADSTKPKCCAGTTTNTCAAAGGNCLNACNVPTTHIELTAESAYCASQNPRLSKCCKNKSVCESGLNPGACKAACDPGESQISLACDKSGDLCCKTGVVKKALTTCNDGAPDYDVCELGYTCDNNCCVPVPNEKLPIGAPCNYGLQCQNVAVRDATGTFCKCNTPNGCNRDKCIVNACTNGMCGTCQLLLKPGEKCTGWGISQLGLANERFNCLSKQCDPGTELCQ